MRDAQPAARHVQMRSDNPSLDDVGITSIEVPLLDAAAVSIAGYGRFVDAFDDAAVDIVTWPATGFRPIRPGTGNEGGVTEGRFEFSREGGLMRARNHAVDGDYITGWLCDPGAANPRSAPADTGFVYVREANYHPDGGQIFFPLDGAPFVALLARPTDHVAPEDFVAFYFDGSRGLHVNPGVWHQPVFPVAERAEFADRQGRVHACVDVDFIDEFRAYLKVPLRQAR